MLFHLFLNPGKVTGSPDVSIIQNKAGILR
jgi:hypothetical protein